MTPQHSYLHLAAAALLGMTVAACSTGPQASLGTVSNVATTTAQIAAIAQLLDRGDTAAARKRLDVALKRDPLDPSLLVLRQGMTGDAREALGPTSFSYIVNAGDTMPALAERFLGNRLKSYQLARYNGIDNPAAIMPGQMLRIPGQAPGGAAEERSPSRPRLKEPRSAVAAPVSRPAPAPSRAAIVDRAGAQRARTAGLAALNKGDVSNAIAQLQRAARLDPGSAVIAGDLARARRISATVRAHR